MPSGTGSKASPHGTTGTDDEAAAGLALLEELGAAGEDARERGAGDEAALEDEGDMPWEDVVRMLLELLNGYWGARGAVGALLAFKPHELELLSATTGPVLRKYFGNAASIEATCLASWGAYIATRAAVLRAARAKAPRDVAPEPEPAAAAAPEPEPPASSRSAPRPPAGPLPNGPI